MSKRRHRQIRYKVFTFFHLNDFEIKYPPCILLKLILTLRLFEFLQTKPLASLFYRYIKTVLVKRPKNNSEAVKLEFLSFYLNA